MSRDHPRLCKLLICCQQQIYCKQQIIIETVALVNLAIHIHDWAKLRLAPPIIIKDPGDGF